MLAPYFYHQQLLQSLSEISLQMIQHRDVELIEFRKTDHDGRAALSSVCHELCRIFLCRDAQLWLREETNTLRFELKGASDNNVFDFVPKTNDDIPAFTFKCRNRSTTEHPADDYFFQAFGQAEGGIRYDRKEGYLHIEDPGLFLVGRIWPEITDKCTTYEAQRGTVNLYADWVNSGPKVLRDYLTSKKGLREIMIFPLTQLNKDKKHEVIGMISLDHDQFFGYGQHWKRTIGLVNDQIMIALEQIGFIKAEDQALRRRFYHEAKEEALYFAGRIDNYLGRTLYFREQLNEIKQMSGIPDTVRHELTRLSRTPELMGSALKECRSVYSNLHEILQNVSPPISSTNDASEDPGWWGQATNIDMEDCIRNYSIGYRNRFRKRGIYWNLDISPKELTWFVPEKLLRSILQNLLDNAAKYALSDSTIEIKVKRYSMCISNQSFFDPNLKGPWPFRSGYRGLTARKSGEPGEGYGMSRIAECCNEILGWKCEFAQKPIIIAGQKRAEFSITIERQR